MGRWLIRNGPSRPSNVKVPQSSFSRLSGAGPFLGVEMASTGEVVCFGQDEYEAPYQSAHLDWL